MQSATVIVTSACQCWHWWVAVCNVCLQILYFKHTTM